MPIDAEYINEFQASHDCLSQSRSSRVRSEGQEFFQLSDETWLGHQDFEAEKITYASLSPLMIKELEFDGRERYEDSGAIEETFKIIIHLRSLEGLVRLARLLEYSRLQGFFQLDPLRSLPEDMLLTLNFSEKSVKENADYLDDLFAIIGQVETLPLELLNDLKSVVAYNCVERFKRKLATAGFKTAIKYLKANRLKNMLSPHYVAALHCRKLYLLKESRELIQSISKDHDSYDFSHALMRSTYEQEIKSLDDELKDMRHQYAQVKTRLLPVVTSHSKPRQPQPVSASISPLPYLHLPALSPALNISKPMTFSPRWQMAKQPAKVASAPTRAFKKPN